MFVSISGPVIKISPRIVLAECFTAMTSDGTEDASTLPLSAGERYCVCSCVFVFLRNSAVRNAFCAHFVRVLCIRCSHTRVVIYISLASSCLCGDSSPSVKGMKVCDLHRLAFGWLHDELIECWRTLCRCSRISVARSSNAAQYLLYMSQPNCKRLLGSQVGREVLHTVGRWVLCVAFLLARCCQPYCINCLCRVTVVVIVISYSVVGASLSAM